MAQGYSADNERVIPSRHVLELLRSFDPETDGSAQKSLELTKALLLYEPRPFSRHSFQPGHITCTGLTLSPGGDRFLVVHHRRLERWLLPGGHVEPSDREPVEAARREVEEETGVTLVEGAVAPLVGIDVHGIPPRGAEPYHLHHDLIFAFRAASEQLRVSAEARTAGWCTLEEEARLGLPANIRHALARALRRLSPAGGPAGGGGA